MKKKICITCKKIFIPNKHTPYQKYCSKFCLSHGNKRKKYLKKYRFDNKKKALLYRSNNITKLKLYNSNYRILHRHKCKDCNKIISIRALRCGLHAQKFRAINKRTYVHCAQCGKILYKCNCLLHKYNFCNKKCQGKWKSINIRGKNCPAFGRKAVTGKIFLYKNIKFRSSWEVKTAKCLTNNHIQWQYEPKTFNLGNCTYTPDFYLPKLDTYLEIKGWWRGDAKVKYLKFRRKFYNIILLNQQKLKHFGILP